MAVDAGISNADPQSPSQATNLGSYEVAPVRILGIPSIVVASPQLHGNSNVVAATQRAELIEGNLRLLYAPQGLCSQAEQLAEQLLEGLVLGGPQAERLCSGDPWGVSWAADQLRLETKPGPIGSVVIQARLPGRPVPLPLLTVTAADGQLYGLQPEQLAQQWRQLLQRRLIHARRTMQPDQLQLRWRVSALLAVLLVGSIVLTMRWWTQLRQRLGRFQSESLSNQHTATRRPSRLLWLSRLVFTALLLEILVLGSVLAAATPGGIPLALALLMQPLEILLKGLATWAVVQALRLMLRLLLRQWRSNPDVPWEQLERRRQRYTNLLQAGQRLLNLAGAVVLLIWVIAGIPGINATPLSTWLAGGALLGALAFVFQGLLRDFVAGLVTLLEDHYAVDDWVEVEGLEGTVEDVGILATVLRCVDQRVMVIPNSRCDRLINHTRLRSGVDLLIPLPPAHPQLEQALAVVGEEADRFAADPHWQPLLLMPPVVRGVKRITPVAVELSVLLQTHTGDQWAAERELLGRIVRRFETEGLLLAQQLAINQPE
jgi:small conductance mechanosensitive channel